MLHDISHDKPTDSSPEMPVTGEQLSRQQAIRQIERKRHFRIRATIGTIGMIILAIIWAFSEYHNAGGWPTHGFSQSSGIHDVWNFWIIYPAIAWVLLTAGDAWRTFGRKPISETEIQREIDRQASLRH
jgi:2TM domain